jgi:hypothetical protein
MDDVFLLQLTIALTTDHHFLVLVGIGGAVPFMAFL